MTIVSSHFDRIPQYKKLLNIFYGSAKEYMPTDDIKIVQFQPGTHGYSNNQEFNHHWDTYYAFITKIKESINTRGNVLMSDTDILFLDSINDVWTKDFDIAITIRDYKCKYNSGICFIKDTPAAKEFLKHWKSNTEAVAKRFNYQEIMEWWGIDQRALHLTLQEKLAVKVIELPCNIWNAEQKSWMTMTPATKVVHIKSGLREIVFGIKPYIDKYNYLKPILERIKKYENSEISIPFYKPSEIGI